MDQVKKLISIILLFTLMSGASAAVGGKPFRVTIDGPRRYINVYQKRAELKMARSTDFCRGFTMPMLVSRWSCKPSDGKNYRCSSAYKCKLIRKGFSRVSETKRIRKELGGLPRVRNAFTMVVGKRPLKNPNKYKYVDQIRRKRKQARVAEKKALRRKVKERTNKLKKQLTEYDEFAQLEKELAIKTEPLPSGRRKDKVDELSTTSLNEDRKQIAAQNEEVAPFRMERVKSNNGNEEIIRIKRSEKVVPKDRKFQLLSFSGAMTRVTDANANSVATADIAWTPRWQFGTKWALRGRLGGHFISSEIVEDEDPETFLVYDLGGELEWFPFSESGWYVNGGLGIQSWTSTTGGSFSTLTLGAGYLFQFNKGKIVDRIFLSMTSVGNEASNQELKVGLGTSF
ncbi:MAG: hypothetical protein NXH75_13025 [Halobacteriovoraceae bacterium]|nr:hypothetical protein [Halobacteriovoraceae bacterium]